MQSKDLFLPKIDSSAAILSFFLGLTENHHLNFHPDTPFDEYVIYGTLDNISVFSRFDSDRLDEKMCECFDWCEANDVDIYLIAMDALKFGSFYESHKVITNRTEMNTFWGEYAETGEPAPATLKALHAFQDGGYICEGQDGVIYLEIENQWYEGTLKELAIILYDWMDKELPADYATEKAF